MPLLQVRDFPADLYEKLKDLAAAERRSIAQQTVVLVREQLSYQDPGVLHARAVDEALRLGGSTPPNDLDPVAMIREDRER